MNIALYAIIFISKVIENALGTLRLIVVANGQKGLGAFLQFLISLVWVLVTGAVVTNITEDPLKVVFFALGSFFGSYVGGFMEEKMAIGNNMITAIIDEDFGDEITNKLRDNKYAVTVSKGEGMDKGRYILMIMSPRKKRHEVVDIITEIDTTAMIVAENATTIRGGYHHYNKKKNKSRK
ncbi:MAG: DUF5698 domain-containing protein [Bacilli bacterium]|nr:DUF5698 domain-containing protein [Bacilli bacterium]